MTFQFVVERADKPVASFAFKGHALDFATRIKEAGAIVAIYDTFNGVRVASYDVFGKLHVN